MEWLELSVENVEIINQQLPYKLAKIIHMENIFA
jgi:hypothetical protein